MSNKSSVVNKSSMHINVQQTNNTFWALRSSKKLQRRKGVRLISRHTQFLTNIFGSYGRTAVRVQNKT